MTIPAELLWWLGLFSLFTFVGTLIVIPAIAVRIPPDYFVREERRVLPWRSQHPVIRGVLLVGKNVLGCVFVLTGILLLALPGQGLLTIAVGVTLLDFPGKFRFERWFISRRPVYRSINWLRQRSGREPLQIPKGDG